MSTEAAILKAIFPPAGAVPLACIDQIDKIRGHIRAAIELAEGGQPVTGRVCNPTSSEALTRQIVALKESPEGAALCWREIGAKLGITADAASKRYYKFSKEREAEELRREGYAAMSGQAVQAGAYTTPAQVSEKIESGDRIVGSDEIVATAQDGKEQEIETVAAPPALQEAKPPEVEEATIRESRIVQDSDTVVAPAVPQEAPEQSKARSSMTAREAGHRLGPKIPHSEDEFIDRRRRVEGARYSSIQAELSARGIACNVDDVIARHHDYRRKQERKAAGKPNHNTPTPKEAGEATQEETSAPQEAQPATDQAGTKPGSKAIGRAELDAKIWQLHKAGKSVEEISNELYAEGLYYSEKSVRVRLISQGAEL